MSRRKPLPLESPHWWPILAALGHHSERVGSDQLAIWDFGKALKAGQLRTMVRRQDGCEELAASAWNDERAGPPQSGRTNFYITPKIQLTPGSPGRYRMRATGMTVWSRKLGGPIIPFHWFFVWRPDYEKIFPDAAAKPAQSRATPPEVVAKRGKKRVYNREDLQSVALHLALQRKQGAPEKTQAEVADELREWGKRNKRKVPENTLLNEIVAAAFQLKPTLER